MTLRRTQFWWGWLVEMMSLSIFAKVTAAAGDCTDLWLFAPGRGEVQGPDPPQVPLLEAGHVQDHPPFAPLTVASPTLMLVHSWRWALSGPAPSLRDVSSGEKALEARALCPSGGEAGEDGGREDNIPNTSPATFTRPKDPKSKAPPSARRCSQRGRKKWAQPKREEAPFHVLRWWRIRQIHQNKKILDLAKNGVLVYLIL